MSKRFLSILLMGSVVWLDVCSVGQVVAEEQRSSTPYEANGKRDPFVPLLRDGRFVGSAGSPSTAHPSDLLLTGIVWDSAGGSFALINETEVAVGDTIGGYQVIEIQRDAVVLVRDGKPLMLQMSFEERTEPGETPESKRMRR